MADSSEHITDSIPSSQVQVKTYMELRKDAIARAAYLLAELRGFSPGDDESDWLDAERFVDAGLRRR